MSDAPSSPNIPQDDDSTKKETIRITLPPKTEQPAVKRETVRIAVPGTQSQPLGSSPKKETSKITLPQSGVTPPPPQSFTGTPPPRPLSTPPAPPKPPVFTGKPTVPLKPAPPTPSGSAPGSGIISKPTSPKKETARISLPSEQPKQASPTLPKATVKLQQTQPLSQSGPSSAIRQQITTHATSVGGVDGSPAKADTLTMVLSLLAFLVAGGAVFFAYSVYDKAQLDVWAK